MSDLMGRGTSQVEVSCGATRKGRVKDNDSVVRGVRLVARWEGRVTKQALGTTGGETDGVDVERAGVSLSESVLHGGLLGGI